MLIHYDFAYWLRAILLYIFASLIAFLRSSKFRKRVGSRGVAKTGQQRERLEQEPFQPVCERDGAARPGAFKHEATLPESSQSRGHERVTRTYNRRTDTGGNTAAWLSCSSGTVPESEELFQLFELLGRHGCRTILPRRITLQRCQPGL